MPRKTVEYYEHRINAHRKKTVTEYAEVISGINFPFEEVLTAKTFSDLSKNSSVFKPFLNGLMCSAIYSLMNEYLFNDTGVPSESIFGFFLGRKNDSKAQKNSAHLVMRACLHAQLSSPPKQNDHINEIKSGLESGLIAPNLHPKDNFPKIVKAIVNQTEEMEDWTFSPEVLKGLNQLENSSHSLQI